ncbi:uncharacterized protein LOC111287956 [Durio zibethinus]|uniref:Uncharacterized protein LOC111287956 n=1 Tax=Durio zibethinus TaxID=66656 RepID=A0A6P5Y1R6_DURZI|nr:uncharacterized protein LOC111287956 [Durio zibethinus]
MNHQFSQLDEGVSSDVETASAFQMAVATVLLALLLQLFWRCCCSCYCNHVKKYVSFFLSSSACGMDPSTIAAVENILNYTFKNKTLLVEALTHSSFNPHKSFARLEFIGDAALGLAVATHFFCLEQPKLTTEQLTNLRKVIVSNKKLARIAAEHGLYWFVRRKNIEDLDYLVKEYEGAVKQGDDQTIKDQHPGILADIVESLAGAVYSDVDFDLKELWLIFRDLLGVDEIELPKDGDDGSSEITGAQDQLYGLCGRRRWTKPCYREEKARDRDACKYVYSVEIGIGDLVLTEKGYEKSSKKLAKNSAAYLLICNLQKSRRM